MSSSGASTSGEDASRRWSDAETLALVDIFWGERIQAMVDNTARNKDCYKKCQEMMADAGYTRSSAEIRTKVNNLKAWYKRQSDRVGKPGKSGGARQKRSEVFERLDHYMCDRASVNPVAIVDPGRQVDDAVEEDSEISDDEDADDDHDVDGKYICIS